MDDDIIGDSSPESEVCGEVAQRPRAPRAILRQGSLRIFIILAGAGGLWGSLKALADTGPRDVETPPAGQAVVIGAALAFSWSFGALDSQALDATHGAMRTQSLLHSRSGNRLGFLDSPVVSSAEFQAPPTIGLPASLAGLAAFMALQVLTREKRQQRVETFESMLNRWRRRCSKAPSFLMVAPRMALAMARGLCACLNTVPVTMKTARKRLLIPTEPTRRQLGAIVAHAEAEAGGRGELPVAARRRHTVPKWSAQLLDPELMLDWLEATQNVKALRKAGCVTKGFGRLFARAAKMPRETLLANIEYIGYETLRAARMRLDCVAMLLWRRFWAQTIDTAREAPNIYIFCDASPTWRAVEFWASSFDLYDGRHRMRRLFPCVALDSQLVDAIGKTLALLWQIYLLVGPSIEVVRHFCSRVRAIVTDMGVERKICDMPDVVSDFYHLLGSKVQAPAAPTDYLWPRALQLPGWKHQVDLLIRAGLSSMRFFPQWLQRLKAINSFLRTDTYSRLLARTLRNAGRTALAESILAAKLPTFAEWRWGTLYECLRALMVFLDSLIEHFDPAPFQHARQQAKLDLVVGALRSRVWRLQCDFVFWFTQWLTKLMQWGCGCACHEAELMAGREVQCPRKGRRLREAAEHVRSEFEGALQTANAWEESTWGCGVEFLAEAQGCVRCTVVVGRQKFEFLDKLPYLLVQLPQPGGRQRALEQWESARPQDHHRVTREFFLEGGRLRKHIDDMMPDGTNIHPDLQAELDSLFEIPMDDSVAEGPHARAKRAQQDARGCRFPWVAASMRLAQNLEDCRDFPGALGQDLLPLWCAWKSLANVDSKRLLNKRMKKGAFLDFIYRMSFCNEAADDAQDAADDDGEGGDDDGNGGDDDGPPPGPSEGGPRVESSRGGDASSGGGGLRQRMLQLTSAAASSSGGGRERPSASGSEIVVLMRQWLCASLEPYAYISAPVSAEEGDFSHMFFQILSVDRKPLYVRTFQATTDEDLGDGLFNVVAQPLQRFRAPDTDPQAGPGTEAEVFVYSDPVVVDILGVCGGGEDNRRHWHIWKPEESDLHGCVALRSPDMLRPRMSLWAADIPVLALCDQLQADGFEAADRRITHEHAAPRVFDSRKLPSKRAYLQCVLALRTLLQAGVESFPSGRTVVYYKVLLKTKRAPDPSMSAKALKKLLAAAEGDTVAMALADRVCDAPPVPRGVKRGAPEPLEDGDDDGSVIGDGDEDAAVIELPAVVAAESHPAIGDDEDAVIGDDAAGSTDLVAIDPNTVPTEILGQAVTCVKGRHDGQWNYHERLSVKCRNPSHGRCNKSRSMFLDNDALGPRAAEGFLGAWLLKSDLPRVEHGRYKPTRAEIRDYLNSH